MLLSFHSLSLFKRRLFGADVAVFGVLSLFELNKSHTYVALRTRNLLFLQIFSSFSAYILPMAFKLGGLILFFLFFFLFTVQVWYLWSSSLHTVLCFCTVCDYIFPRHFTYYFYFPLLFFSLR